MIDNDFRVIKINGVMRKVYTNKLNSSLNFAARQREIKRNETKSKNSS